MQRICAIILLSALAYEALPQTKWSRPIRNPQGQLTRERRQFPFGEWIPLSQPCPTCRPFADPSDVGLRDENIGLTPPRPPTITRQIHGEGNFFPQDESSILSVPPPPPSAIPRQPNGNFQFSSFGQQFNNPLPVPTQKIFPQTQQIQFLSQPFLTNQALLVNGNQQIISGLNGQGNVFSQEHSQQQINNGKVNGFGGEFKTQKIPENVVLEQNNRQVGAKQTFSNKPQPFTPPPQNQQQTFVQQQTFGNQQQHSVNFENSILTPPPAPKNVSQDIVIPGLDKEEIQLLYVPVETLRQRGTPQEQQLLSQQPQNVQFFNRGNNLKRPVNNVRPTEQTIITQQKGHFITQNGNNQDQSDSSLKVTSSQPFPTTVTPSSLLLQHLPFQQTPQPFVSATPATPTIQPFVTPASVFQKFSSFTPETTLPHLSTVPNTIQFSQSDIEFGTTPKTITNQGVFKEEIINGKSQFSELKNAGLIQEQPRPFVNPQPFVNQQQTITQQPLTTVFSQGQQKELLRPTHFPHQIDQQQIALQKQQEQQRLLQQQRQKEFDEQRILEQKRKQKELDEQRALQQQQHQKELEEQRILQQQQQRQKELEEQRFLQKQKELEEQRLLQQQRQKELEQQRYIQKQKELEEQRLLQQQRQKELEEQRFLQQQRQKEIEEQRFLQEQRQKELENQRRLQLQKQKELEEKRRIQQKQKEEEQRLIRFQQQQKQKEDEQRLLRFQQQQKELEQQRLLQKQQEEQQRALQQQQLQKQKQENLKKQQQFQFYKQQQQQQQNFPQQAYQQQTNRHVLPANDNLNFIQQLEKESEPEDQQLVPHQPPLSVFFRGQTAGESRITDVLRELRNSNTITVLDQYFEKMPKVFVGPAGLVPPSGYNKFELPYLSNLETNKIERKIGQLPFFVAPLNFVPPPGYAKIPFPAPHIGSVVVSSESNPAMTTEKGSVEEENISGGFPVVGPELPGLINNLDTETTTVKPVTYVSTPSLPQTTAQLRNRRPSSSLYKPQSRKPITRTRPTTTSKPEEEVTQPIQRTEIAKDTEGGLRKPFNRFLNRRRQQSKSTTETPLKSQQEGKNLENRFYSVEVYHQEKNQVPKTQQKSDIIKQTEGERFQQQFEHGTSIDRITPGGHGVFEVRPTPDLSQTVGVVSSEERRQEIPDYADVNLQNFEDGPLPTGSAKTITQELYRPNAIAEGEVNTKTLSKLDSTSSSVRFQSNEDVSPTGISEASPSVDFGTYKDTVSEGQVSAEPTSVVENEKSEISSERYDSTEPPTQVTASGEQQTKGFLNSNEEYTSAFAEISKPHHIPGFVDSSQRQYSKFADVSPTPEISVDLQAPQPQEFEGSVEVKSTENSENSNKFLSSNEQYQTGFEGVAKNQKNFHVSSSQVTPTAPGATEEQYNGFSINTQNSAEAHRQSDDQRIGSFISVQDVHSTSGSPISHQEFVPSSPASHQEYVPGSSVSQQEYISGSRGSHQEYVPGSTAVPSQTPVTDSHKINEFSISPIVEQNPPQFSSTPQTIGEATVNPSIQTYTSAPGAEGLVQINDQTHANEGHGQDIANNLPNDHRLKFPNPSIVRVRTRVRGKSRGQVNFAASHSTTPVPFTRSTTENKHNENTEQEFTTKTNHFREFHPVKTSKFNQFRGVKKPVRTTTEATTTTEHEQRSNVYTIRPPRRPLNPSTVSTKRIRRPTTPLPSVESATEVSGISTSGTYQQSEHSDISPSGVSNDVYYEQSSLSPVKHKFRKHFGSAEQKSDIVPAYISTAFPSASPTYSTFVHEEYSEDTHVVRQLAHTEAPLDNSQKYPEWNPSESGFDVSGIVLTTIRTPGQQEEDQFELEERKKSQDSKKAFDPELEKKTGRRRVRVRVHKRPHENFETAESQNLRTVANVLVPPTTTYKPNDESSFHQLAKNADFSFGGQKLFGVRSREYFKKRLNLTEGVKEGEQITGPSSQGEAAETAEKSTEAKSFIKKAEKVQKNDFESVSSQSNESNEGGKLTRPKFRGFVRKIIKHGGVAKEVNSESNQLEHEEGDGKHENSEYHLRQSVRGGFNHTVRGNGTRHKTFVRYVKKNKIRQHDTETVQESNIQEPKKEEQSSPQFTEPQTQTQETQTSHSESQTTEEQHEEEKIVSQSPVKEQQTDNANSQQPETTEEPEVKQTQQPSIQTTQAAEIQESSSQIFQEVSQEPTSDTPQPSSTVTQLTGLYLTQRPKFYQTLRPVFQRTTPTAPPRSREPEPTTEQNESQEKRTNYRLKYGKTTGFGQTGSGERSDETKKVTEQETKNKNLHTLEVRKYLRTKNREGAFSQFSKNKYVTSKKTETFGTTTDHESVEHESEEITTEKIKLSSSEPITTESVIAHTESKEVETTVNEEDSELPASTTETITSSEEESSEEDVTSSDHIHTTTETEIPTTIFHQTSTPEKVTEQKIPTQTTEPAEPQRTEYEPDIYRFSKNTFSFDETQQFTGTKNRAHVRNITSDIIENTASFSAPGVEKRPEIHVVVTHRSDEQYPPATESQSNNNQKTESGITEINKSETTESNKSETTTEYPESTETETAASTDAVTKSKIAKILKTSTTTKISHETEICYRGKCIRTKNENPDEDLKLLVDSASIMKIEKTKT